VPLPLDTAYRWPVRITWPLATCLCGPAARGGV